MGESMDVVELALTAWTDGRFDELAPLIADDLDWQGLVGEDGVVPTCHGREQALAIMRNGLLSRGEVAVRELEEYGSRVLVIVTGRAEEDAPARFLVVTVAGGQVTSMIAHADESAARATLTT